jgi:hypothetical protein
MAQLSGSAPTPPYSSGAGSPSRPTAAHWRHSSRGKTVRAVALDDLMVEFAARELDDAVAQQLLLAVQIEVHQRSSFRRW